MAVFVQLTTDRFASTFNATRAAAVKARRAGTANARRPLRGLEIKNDTYAILRVVRADGTKVDLLDSGTKTGTTQDLTNFILQSVQEARMEKHQIVETFGEPYIYFFGESPRFLDVRAILVDSLDFNWYAEFWENYNRYLRGTRSVEMGARTYLFYDDNIVQGYMLNATAVKTSDSPLQAQLTFRLYLTDYANITIADGSSANTNFPLPLGAAPVTVTPGVVTPAPDPNVLQPSSGQGPSIPIFNNLDEFTGTPDAPTTATSAPPAFPLSQVLNAITLGASVVRSIAAGQVTIPPGLNVLFGVLGAAVSASGLDALQQETFGAPTFGSPLSPGGPGTGGASGTPAALLSMPVASFASLGQVAPVGPGVAVGAGVSLSLGSVDPVVPASPYEDEEADTAGQPDATDLSMMSIQTLATFGADINDPATFAALGMAPYFTTPQGFGVFGAAGSSASFGVAGMGSLGSTYYGGINGGLGFVGNFSSTTSVAGPATPSVIATTTAPTTVFGNGVPIQGGVVSGTGVGGGIPGGLGAGVGPGGPGTLIDYTGGSLFAAPNGFSSSQGYGGGVSANGAAINVGGAPTSFAVVVVSGELDPTGSIEPDYFVGPGGNFSYTNTTGIFV